MKLAFADVYQFEMKQFGKISEQELDRLFAGRASAELGELGSFVQKAQSTYLIDVDPKVEAAHLSELMRIVNLTDKGDLAAKSASKVTGPEMQASGLPKIRRRFMLESIFASLAAKLAVGGISVAMATTGLAATGNLPDRVQSNVADAVENIGLNIPNPDAAEDALDEAEEAFEEAAERAEEALEAAADASDDAEEASDDAADASDDASDDVAGEDDDEGNEPNENSAFGQATAAAAHARNAERKEAAEAAKDADEDADASDDVADVEDTDESDDVADVEDADESDDAEGESGEGRSSGKR